MSGPPRDPSDPRPPGDDTGEERTGAWWLEGAIEEAPSPEPALAAPPPAPPAPAFLGPADGDDDDDDERFVPWVGLETILAPLAETTASEGGNEETVLAAEIARVRGGVISDAAVVGGRRRRWQPPSGALEVRRDGPGLVLGLRYEDVRGTLTRSGVPEPLPPAPHALALEPGDVVTLRDHDTRYRVLVTRAPARPPREPLAFSARVFGASFVIAAALHLASGYGVSWLSATGMQLTIAPTDTTERFAEGTLEAPKPQQRKAPKPVKLIRPRRPERPPPPPDPTEQAAAIPKVMRQKIRKAMGGGSRKARARRLAEQLASPHAGDGATLDDVVSNLDAVGAKGRATGAHRIGGTLDSLDGAPNLALGGGGAAGTLAGKDATRGVGRLKRARKGGKVRGKVKAISTLAKVQGRLSRSQVQEVLNKRLGRIQGCYERELLSSPELSGKITFEWTVTEGGRVDGARVRASSLGSPKVANCILKILRGLRFPSPEGGPVVVSYPFIFRSAAR